MVQHAFQAPERERMDADVVIIGAGPAGLATAIQLAKLSQAANEPWSIIVLEKGAEVGAHILSGAVIDPSGLDALVPDWRSDATCPLTTEVTDDRFYVLGPSGAIRLPQKLFPKSLHNQGCLTGSLGLLCRWLAARAEAMGVQIFPGFAAAELIKDNGRVVGVATGDMGLSREGQVKASFTRGVAIHARYVVLAEGVRGHLSKALIQDYGLANQASPQKHGIGLKEVWRIDPKKHRPGLVQHTLGWPLDNRTGGGSFLYHYAEDLVSVGFVVHLDYKNPYLSPYEEFQRFKHHPLISEVLEGGERISYGARALSEGGFQSVPRLVAPGALLVGCAAGFVNVPRIKGTHNAMQSGLLAAEHLAEALKKGTAHEILESYEKAWRDSPIGLDLRPVRNVKPLWSRFGTGLGMLLAGAELWCQSVFKASPWGTLNHQRADHEALMPISEAKPIDYPKPDGVLSFDRLSSVQLTNVWHEEDQPVHLQLRDPLIPISINLPNYAEPAQRYCPAGVYEVVTTASGPQFVINAQNCIHCKTCDIKDPSQNITWVTPEGGQGPSYAAM